MLCDYCDTHCVASHGWDSCRESEADSICGTDTHKREEKTHVKNDTGNEKGCVS